MKPSLPLTPIYNGEALAIESVANLDWPAFAQAILQGTEGGWRVVSYFGLASPQTQKINLVALLADDEGGQLRIGMTSAEGRGLPSLAEACPQVHLFEREIAEQFGLDLQGHPWPKPVRFVSPAQSPIGVMDFYQVNGEEIHEVAVGPVHAGIIEPGHFRFQCHGEQVLHLEISLGYQHRGVEQALLGGPHRATLRQLEAVAGDSTIAHGSAYCMNLEALAGANVPSRAEVLRAIALELERLANHTGDLGALAGDVGYLPTMSYCGRIRGDFLNMTALMCGSRFGRCLLQPGGVRFDLTPPQVDELRRRLLAAERDVREAVELLWNTPSVIARFEEAGVVTRRQALEIGLVGPPARACGIERDVRTDHPTGIYRFVNVPLVTAHHGDVYSRAFVRYLEIERSIQFILERLGNLPAPAEAAPLGGLGPERIAVALAEGWRGEVCHVAVTDGDGRFARYKITDPSFHNWFGLALALRGQEISDFPMCNKSFNLSYCGFDL